MNIANKLTVLRLCCIPIFMWSMYAFDNYYVAAVIFIAASLTDFLDGYLARKYQLITTFGKFADPLADKLLVLSAFVLLIQTHNIPAWIVAVIICREVAVTGLRLLLVEDNRVLAADWSGKVKTVTQMLAIVLLLLNDLSLNIPLGMIFLYICLLLTVYSGVEYFYKNRSIFENIG